MPLAPPTYELPAATRLGGVRLQVADLARSLAYYEGVLGLGVTDRSRDRARLSAANTDDWLIALHARPGATPAPPRGRLGLYHFAILLPDRRHLGRFLAHLLSLSIRPGLADHSVSESIYLYDPDGLGIEVYADRPRATWQSSGAELHLTVDPLDVEDLLRAGAGQAWSGMPPGTTMGHVHFSVDSLDRAEDFFYTGLGFAKTAWSFPGALFLAAGGYHHHIGTNTWAAGAPRATDADARLIEWQLRLPSRTDCDTAAHHLAQAGHQTTADGDAYAVTDPWGQRVSIRNL